MDGALPYEFLAILPFGVVLSTADGRLVHANPLAGHLLRRRQPIGVGPDGRLNADAADDTRSLREAVRAVTSGEQPRVLWRGGATSHRPQPVVVRPVVTVTGDGPPLAAIFLADPRAMPREATLRELHGLTPAEARVALELLQGHRVSQAARRLGTSPNTVKTQLQRVYEKLLVSRQSELVRLLMDPVGNL